MICRSAVLRVREEWSWWAISFGLHGKAFWSHQCQAGNNGLHGKAFWSHQCQAGNNGHSRGYGKQCWIVLFTLHYSLKKWPFFSLFYRFLCPCWSFLPTNVLYCLHINVFLIFIISLSSLLFLYIWTKVTPHKNRRCAYLTHLRGLGYVQIFTNVQTFCEFLQKCIWKSRSLIRKKLMNQIYGLFKAFWCHPEEGI